MESITLIDPESLACRFRRQLLVGRGFMNIYPNRGVRDPFNNGIRLNFLFSGRADDFPASATCTCPPNSRTPQE